MQLDETPKMVPSGIIKSSNMEIAGTCPHIIYIYIRTYTHCIYGYIILHIYFNIVQ